MKKCLILLIFIIFSSSTIQASSLSEESSQAMAFFAARDFDRSRSIYERLLKTNRPDWQKARILYNLATVLLAQNQAEKALTLFQSILLDQISAPQLLRYLKTNEGLAYLRRAENFNKQSSSNQQKDLNQQIYLLHRSLESFSEAQKIDCLLQKLEEPNQDCLFLSDLQNLNDVAHTELNLARQEQKHFLLQKEQLNQAGLILIDALNQYLLSIQQLENSPFKESTQAYLIKLGQSILPLFNPFNTQKLEKRIKQSSEKANNLFQQSLEEIKRFHYKKALTSLEQTLTSLEDLLEQLPTFNREFEHLFIHYLMLLQQDHLQPYALKKLIIEQDRLKVEDEGKKQLNRASEGLSISLEQLKHNQSSLAHFFLTYSFYIIQDLMQKDQAINSATDRLTKALEQAQRATQLNRLAQVENPPYELKQQIKTILNQTQNQVITIAKLFPSQVLEEEKESFRKIGLSIAERCQKNPWERAIPLFEKGYQSALLAQNNLEKDSMQNQLALAQQEQTLVYWQQALQLLKQPPSTNAASQSEEKQQDQNQSQTNLNEVLNDLQEMQAEDNPASQNQPGEVKGW